MRKRIELPENEMVKFIVDHEVFAGEDGPEFWAFNHSISSLEYWTGEMFQTGFDTPTVVYQETSWWENIPEEGVLVEFARDPGTIVTATQHHKTTQGWDLVWVGDNQVNVSLLIPVTKDHPLIKGLIENS